MGGAAVTVGTKVKTTLSSLKSAQADLESFALETQDKAAKQLWGNAAEQVKKVIQQIEPRVQQIEREEPQYRGY